MPVQRPPRYNLLLGGLLKTTSPDDKDFQILTNAQNSMEQICKDINKEVSNSVNESAVLKVMESLTECSNLLEPQRKYLGEGETH